AAAIALDLPNARPDDLAPVRDEEDIVFILHHESAREEATALGQGCRLHTHRVPALAGGLLASRTLPIPVVRHDQKVRIVAHDLHGQDLVLVAELHTLDSLGLSTH